MTMPEERTRAVIQTHEFLIELARDASIPERVRCGARFLLRHYPSKGDVLLAGRIEEHDETLPIGIIGPVFASTYTER